MVGQTTDCPKSSDGATRCSSTEPSRPHTRDCNWAEKEKAPEEKDLEAAVWTRCLTTKGKEERATSEQLKESQTKLSQ